jgi:hypothetical protein
MDSNKQVYVAPTLTVYGDVEVITQGFDVGGALDADFPDGTPRGDLTFS